MTDKPKGDPGKAPAGGPAGNAPEGVARKRPDQGGRPAKRAGKAPGPGGKGPKPK